MKTSAQNLTQLWCELIIDQLIKAGVKQFYGCPGMRNAPLLRAAALNPQATLLTGWDERSQSYRALSFIKAKGEPAALLCTSGTAVANFLPAVIEAQKTHAPLIVLSGDRPGELNASDANQTINQVEVLRDYCKEFWSASEPQETFAPRALTGKVSFLIHKTLQRPRGPLHLNIPLREPLDDTALEITKEWKEEALSILENPKNSVHFPKAIQTPEESSLQELAQHLLGAKNPLVVFGPLHGPSGYNKDDVLAFLESYQANFSCDITSGLKLEYGAKDGLIPTLDHPEVQNVLEKEGPDLVVHFGHRLTSKHYYGLLRRLLSDKVTQKIIHIGAGHFHEDPSFSVTERWDLDPREVLKGLVNNLKKSGPIKRAPFDWGALIEKKRSLIEEGPLSYPFITKRAVDTLTSAKKVFIGNSTFIRSMDSYATMEAPPSSWTVITHRGASGIEGHIASALGMHEANPLVPSVTFLGDVSLIHDLGSLVSLSEFTKNEDPLLIILANNGRGGIFNLLPLASKTESKAYINHLTTPHQQNFQKICEAMNLEVQKVKDKRAYQDQLENWNKNPRRLILEVVFDDQDNIDVYKKLKTVRL